MKNSREQYIFVCINQWCTLLHSMLSIISWFHFSLKCWSHLEGHFWYIIGCVILSTMVFTASKYLQPFSSYDHICDSKRIVYISNRGLVMSSGAYPIISNFNTQIEFLIMSVFEWNLAGVLRMSLCSDMCIKILTLSYLRPIKDLVPNGATVL